MVCGLFYSPRFCYDAILFRRVIRWGGFESAIFHHSCWNGFMFFSHKKWIPVICLVFAMLLWGGSFIALKIAFRAYDPMVVIFGRMFVASLCFLVFWRKLKREDIRRSDVKPILLMAIFEPCLYFVFEARAIENTTASQAGMITAMLPLMVAIAAVFILRERLHVRTLLGFILAVAGAILLSVKGDQTIADAPNPALGNFFEFLAMVSATGYTISLKKLSARHSAFFLTAVQAFIGAVFFGLFLFLPATRLPDHVDMGAIIAVAYLGAVVTMGAYFLYNYGVSQMPASKASAFVNLIPVFTLALGWMILGETFTSMQFIASGIIFAGVLLSQK